jgi:hypothetical protein
MKKFLMALAAVALVGGTAVAGPNAGGTIFLHDANIAYTPDDADYCPDGTPPPSCLGADVRIDELTPVVWKMYAAFPEGSSPRLKGITFGISYDAAILVLAGAPCPAGTFELPDTNWPASGTGNSLVWDQPQMTQLVQVYWFGGYNYEGSAGVFALTANPGSGTGQFADDSVPSLIDDITGYGTLGFLTDGTPACPPDQVPGACCFGEECVVLTESECLAQGGRFDGSEDCDPNPCQLPRGACCFDELCVILTQGECEGQGGIYKGDNVPCEPENPCEIIPVEPTTWGKIKSSW